MIGNLTINANNANLKIETGGTERLRIDSSGRLSLGNTVASTIGAVTNVADLVIGDGYNAAGITIYTGTDKAENSLLPMGLLEVLD